MIKKLVMAVGAVAIIGGSCMVVADKDDHRGFHQTLKQEHGALHRDVQTRHRLQHEIGFASEQDHEAYHRSLKEAHRQFHRDLKSDHETFHAKGSDEDECQRDRRFQRGSNPRGWSHGRKVGWGGSNVPPGHTKRHGFFRKR